MTQYVAYYRVSTDKQGIKSLGMDAQREAVARFMWQGPPDRAVHRSGERTQGQPAPASCSPR